MSKIARSTLIVAFFLGLEKVLGFARQYLVAHQFGLSAELDAFNAANNLPDLLFVLISGGALGVALIPVLSEYLEKSGRPEMWRLFSRITNLIFLITAALSLIVALLAPLLVQSQIGIAPGFTAEQQDLVVSLMRLNLVATLLFSLAGLSIAGLQANKYFTLPALAPSMYDIGSLFGILVLVPEQGYQVGPITLPAFGLGIYGLVYGTILGALLFFVVQIPGLLAYHFHWTPKIGLGDPGVRKVLSLMGPRVLTMACIQLIFLIQDNLASRLAEGSISSLVYGWLFMQVPETLIGTALATVLLPTFSEQFVRSETDQFRQILNRTLRILLALTIPSAVLLSIVIRPVIGMLGFDAAGTDMVTWVTRAFMIGLVGHSLLEIAARSFYAQQDARTPLATAAVTVVFFTALAAVLASWLGGAGIALANSLAFTAQAILLLYLVNRRFGGGLLQVGSTLLRVIPGALLAAGAAYLILQLGYQPLLLAVAALAAGGLLVLPFIWPEMKTLFRL